MSASSQAQNTKGSVSAAPQITSAPQAQNAPGQSDGYLRRSGGSGSFGAGASTRSSSSPRSNQALRKQHKGRRPKLGIEESALESAGMGTTSSRKGRTSITHLMNFSLPPRPQSTYTHQHSRRGGPRRPTWGLGSGYHAVDKARYIHANYRFIVDPRGQYSRHAVDPDIHVDWNDVLQILASAQSQSASCPICLSVPVAPRMARCGHIFCLPCLIRYMHSSDDTNPLPEKKARWKSCPICWDSVYMSDMRPVRWFQGQESKPPHEGEDVVLRLITRKPGSIIALPRDGADTSSLGSDIPWYFAAEVADYARMMKGSEEYIQSSFDLEIEEIRLQEQEDQIMFGEESQWTKKAISVIKEMKAKANGTGNPPTLGSKPESYEATSLAPIDEQASRSKVVAGGPSHAGSGLSSLRSNSVVSSNPGHSEQDSPFFFYQALLHYYLSPLDIRILRTAFGDYASFPSTVLPRVERVSTGHIVDDDLRKRAKYIGHLPMGCEVGFLECDWTDVVAPKILEGFAGEIDRRRKRNREKEAREEKERLRAEKEEDDKRWAAGRRRKPRDLSPEGFAAVADQVPIEPHNLASSATSSSPPWGSSSRRNGSSFASLASPSTSPSAPRTVWGTTAITPSSPQLSSLPADDAIPDDGWLQDWERDLLHEEQLISQIEATSLGEGSSSQAGSTPTPGNKKKKNKKITLMSTNARRAA